MREGNGWKFTTRKKLSPVNKLNTRTYFLFFLFFLSSFFFFLTTVVFLFHQGDINIYASKDGVASDTLLLLSSSECAADRAISNISMLLCQWPALKNESLYLLFSELFKCTW